MKAGITGPQYSGKTTLFCALTGQDYEHIAHQRDVHVGTVKVPDRRLENLYEMFEPKKVTHAAMEYFDVAGKASGTSREIEPKDLLSLKIADSLIIVLDSFSENEDVVGVFKSFMDELAFNDLVMASNRIERLEKEIRSGKTDTRMKEKNLMEQYVSVIEGGGMIRDLVLNSDDEKMIRGFQFLTYKPILIVANISEQFLTDGKADEIEKSFHAAGQSDCAAICAELEMEIAAIENAEERIEFLDSMGIEEPALERLIRLSYKSMGLISFFTTVGKDEVRAWTASKNSTAVECAGIVHSDMARGFIRAETISCDDLLKAGSLKAARDKGLLRIEGKEYIVQDGDVLTIRFNV